MSKIKKNTIFATFYGIIFWCGLVLVTAILKRRIPSLEYLLGFIPGGVMAGLFKYYSYQARDNKKKKEDEQ